MRMGIGEGASWHNDYAESAYVFVANLNYEMSEGDIAIVFS
jgi:RNA-binding motif X-linked protein 2